MSITKIKMSSKGTLTKAQIRSKILKRLKTQEEEDREIKSRRIKNKLFGLKIFKRAKRVMFYIPFGGEVDTREMIKAAQKKGKIVAVPVTSSRRMMRPGLFDSRARLVKGPYGVWEPAIKKSIRLENLDLVIVPGLAFDKKGNRLGRGKGCYDYFLSRLPDDTPIIGLAFDFQILPLVPTTPMDVAVCKVLCN